MLLRLTRHLVAVSLLALVLVSLARAGVTVDRTLRIEPDRLPSAGPIEIPLGERVARVTVVSIECAEDGARAPVGATIRLGYQGFERGRASAWLELPSGSGLPVEHAQHALKLRVRL